MSGFTIALDSREHRQLHERGRAEHREQLRDPCGEQEPEDQQRCEATEQRGHDPDRVQPRGRVVQSGNLVGNGPEQVVLGWVGPVRSLPATPERPLGSGGNAVMSRRRKRSCSRVSSPM